MASAAQFIQACESEVGYTEDPPGSNRTKFAAEAGHANGTFWCLTFLDALACRTSLALPPGVLGTAYTPTAVAAFKRAKRWTVVPEVGAWVFFDFPDDVHRVQHVAVVTAVRKDGRINTIEGNTSAGNTGSQSNGGGVFRRVRDRSIVVGYGLPYYDEAAKPAPAPAPEEDEPDTMFCYRDNDGKVWLVEGRKRRHINRPSLDALVHAGALQDPHPDPLSPEDTWALALLYTEA